MVTFCCKRPMPCLGKIHKEYTSSMWCCSFPDYVTLTYISVYYKTINVTKDMCGRGEKLITVNIFQKSLTGCHLYLCLLK